METVNFTWIEMNDETFKLIKRKGTHTSENVLAVGSLGACLVGRIHKHEDTKYGYTLVTYLGGGFNNVVKFIPLDNIINNG